MEHRVDAAETCFIWYKSVSDFCYFLHLCKLESSMGTDICTHP